MRSDFPLEIRREAVVKESGREAKTCNGAKFLQWEMNKKSIPCAHLSFPR